MVRFHRTRTDARRGTPVPRRVRSLWSSGSHGQHDCVHGHFRLVPRWRGKLRCFHHARYTDRSPNPARRAVYPPYSRIGDHTFAAGEVSHRARIVTYDLSPRWLIEVGRLEEAKTVLTLLRSTATGEEVDAEVQRIDEIIHLDRLANKSSWADLFRGSNLMRTLTVLGVMCISQANGESTKLGSTLTL